jgi:hypothetical protein
MKEFLTREQREERTEHREDFSRKRKTLPAGLPNVESVSLHRAGLGEKDGFEATIERYLNWAKGAHGTRYQTFEVIYRQQGVGFPLLCVAWDAYAEQWRRAYPEGSHVYLEGRWKVWGKKPAWRRCLSVSNIYTRN